MFRKNHKIIIVCAALAVIMCITGVVLAITKPGGILSCL